VTAKPRVTRHFADIGGRQMHYRRVGSGPPVILLHPSPQSSAFSLPMALRLAKNFTAIAVDTPGYGLSDPLPAGTVFPADRDRGLDPYIAPLRRFMDALGIAKAAIYGNATGAEIAHIFAHAHPERVAVCMIDSAGDRSDAETDAETDGYFLDVTPRRDGGHLLSHWEMVRSLSLFAPWQKTAKENRLDVDMPPPEQIQAKLLDYLRAGPDYPLAYRPAFYTAKHRLIARVKVPATLTRWVSKPNLEEVDALIAKGLPANFTVLHAGPTMDERLGASERYLIERYLPSAAAAPAPSDPLDRAAARLQKMYVDVPGGQLLARACFAGKGRPILGLHDPAGSSRRLEAFLSPYLGRRPVIALDLPSSGESDKLLTPEAISIAAYAEATLAALDALGITEVDIIGRYSGGQVAMELARIRPGLVKHIVQAGVMIFDDAERAELLANYTPSIAPRWDGGHLITAWAMLRDMSLFWPWYNRTKSGVLHRDAAIDAASLDARVQDLLKIGDAYRNAYAASFTYPMAERLKALAVPCLAVDLPGTGSYPRLAMAKAAAPNVAVADLPDDPRAWPAVMDPFFAA
jgi:pimeloyl-ACP methyl ester carboxylesterase